MMISYGCYGGSEPGPPLFLSHALFIPCGLHDVSSPSAWVRTLIFLVLGHAIEDSVVLIVLILGSFGISWI
jgi:hypothetical protein